MSTKTAGRIVGALFLLAFALYLPGSILIDSTVGAADALGGVVGNETRIAGGALLMLANSVAVVGIGLFALPVVRPHAELAARAYLLARAAEAIMLAVGVVFLLLLIPLAHARADLDADGAPLLSALAQVAQEGNHYAYSIGMIALGVGSLPFWWAVHQARLVPRPIAVWGLAGYGIFAIGMALDILGYGVGMALSLPGGLFEIVVGVLLVVRGFAAGPVRDGDLPAGAAAPAAA